jgi:uncharacterized protein
MLKKLNTYFKLKFLLRTFILFLFVSQAIAQDIPPQPNPPRMLNDFVMKLNGVEAETLEQKLRGYRDSTSTEIAVVIVKTTGDYDPFDYGMKIFNTWGIGKKGKNNGVLLLWATETRKLRIITGRAAEGAIPDAIAKRIINSILKPAFQNNQFYLGLDEATTEMFQRLTGEFKADAVDGEEIPFWVILLIMLFIFFIIYGISKGGGGRGGRRNYSDGGVFFPTTISSWGSSSSGSWGSSDSGGGGGFDFGGFGGGESGGGGAGGDY